MKKVVLSVAALFIGALSFSQGNQSVVLQQGNGNGTSVSQSGQTNMSDVFQNGNNNDGTV